MRAHCCGKAQIALRASELLEVGAAICLRELLREAYVGVASGLLEAFCVRTSLLLLLVLGLIELIERNLDGLSNLYVMARRAVFVFVGNDIALELLGELPVHVRCSVDIETGLDEQGCRLNQALEFVSGLLRNSLHGNGVEGGANSLPFVMCEGLLSLVWRLRLGHRDRLRDRRRLDRIEVRNL